MLTYNKIEKKLYGEHMAIEICGGREVCGKLRIQGSKNAVLPIMAASVLAEGETIIENCPDIRDVHAMADVLRGMGAAITYLGHTLTIDTTHIKEHSIEEKEVEEIRASILLLGSVLARFRMADIRYPGGCSIGCRPIDYHLQAFRDMGARVEERENRICCDATGCFGGAEITLEFPSVGATENILLAAVTAEGETTVYGAAREPEIVQLCHFLSQMGGKIRGIGTGILRIQGVKRLYPVRWKLGSDRIVFLTWAMLTAGCGGQAELLMEEEIPVAEQEVLEQMGCVVRRENERIFLVQNRVPRAIRYLKTRPYPGYPTDGQSLLLSVLCKGNGISTIEESIFENRLQMIRQLRKMGANIDSVCNRARITGVTKLHGAAVEADDLRSGAGLLIAAAMAEGTTQVSREQFIERGYENVVEQLRSLGICARTTNSDN